MKKIRVLAMLLAAAMLLSACAAPHAEAYFEVEDGNIPMPEITPAPVAEPETEETPLPEAQQVGQVVYDPLRIPSAFEDSEDFSRELYVLMATAVRAEEKTADFSALQITEEQFNTVRRFLVTRNPWGNLSDITKGEGAAAQISYVWDEAGEQEDDDKDDKKKDDEIPQETPAPVEKTDTVKRFDDEAALMLQTVVKPESTQLTAAIALYKHIAQNVTADFEAADRGIYSVVVDGTGTALTCANAYSFMLDQIGVENVVVTSEDGSHAWNVLTIDGNSYHCDIQTEAGLNGGQALTCFGLSDADAARMNGWNTWVSENSKLLTCSDSLFEQIHAADHADVDATGNAVYFDGMNGMNGIWRMDLNNGTVLQLTQDEIDALAVLGEHVYYRSAADGMMYRYRIADGDVRQAIEGVEIADLRRVGTEIRYIAADDPTESENAISIE